MSWTKCIRVLDHTLEKDSTGFTNFENFREFRQFILSLPRYFFLSNLSHL
jgi:hypothetical protein